MEGVGLFTCEKGFNVHHIVVEDCFKIVESDVVKGLHSPHVFVKNTSHLRKIPHLYWVLDLHIMLGR